MNVHLTSCSFSIPKKGFTGEIQTSATNMPINKDTTCTNLNGPMQQKCSVQPPGCINKEEYVKLNDVLSSTYSTYDFSDLPMLWSNPEDVSLDKIVPSLQLFPSVF